MSVNFFLANIRQMMTSNFNQLNFDNPFFLSDDEYIKVTVAIKHGSKKLQTA